MTKATLRFGVLALALVLACAIARGGAAEDTMRVVIGSKKFTESVILATIAEGSARAADVAVEHRAELGGSRILFNALLAGEIDVYPEYSGTIARELLRDDPSVQPGAGMNELRGPLAARGVIAGAALGFDNSYAIGMRRDEAERLGIGSISDLAAHPELRYGFTNEFLDRGDGWPGLARRYGLSPTSVRGLDHDLAYRALKQGAVDISDLYTTDAEIEAYDLVLLDDDRDWFPAYAAVLLWRSDLAQRAPEFTQALAALAGSIDAPAMRSMNAAVKIHGRSEKEVAARFLDERGDAVRFEAPSLLRRLLERTREHLAMTAVSLAAAIALAIPAGVLAAARPGAGRVILASTGVLQTIPALALLVVLIPLFGIGTGPAIIALFLYSLLPIVRGTHAGLASIPDTLLRSAEALGLSEWERLRLVEIPMAVPSILAGIKTAAVINIGTATLGALVGAGGYGQPILTGIRLDDTALILEGAIPAAALALLAQALFDLGERRLLPRGLRQRPDRAATSKVGKHA